jgi:N-dimethylarginine dimethylaminohydrolase
VGNRTELSKYRKTQLELIIEQLSALNILIENISGFRHLFKKTESDNYLKKHNLYIKFKDECYKQYTEVFQIHDVTIEDFHSNYSYRNERDSYYSNTSVLSGKYMKVSNLKAKEQQKESKQDQNILQSLMITPEMVYSQ